jgi:hypothetical protein
VSFHVEDETHCESRGTFATCADALSELERLAGIPFGTAPNRPPCTTGTGCERRWRIVDERRDARSRRGRTLVIDARGARWSDEAR